MASSGQQIATHAHGVEDNISVSAFDRPQDIQKRLTIGDPPRLGPAQAPATLVVFEDFECSFCRQMNELIERQLLPHHASDVNVVYRYFPLPQHPWAHSAAEMAECVKLQNNGAFWKLNDFLYMHQDSFSARSIRSDIDDFLVKENVLDIKTFDGCMDERLAAPQVDSDIQMAASLGVHATPTLFMNGVRLHGIHEIQQLEDAVKVALQSELSEQDDKDGRNP